MTVTLLAFCAVGAVGADFETAAEAARNMRVGWNAGNALESNSGDTLNMWIEQWTDRSPRAYETAWGQRQSTAALMKMMREAGMNTIRIPVTWYPHMEATFSSVTYNSSTSSLTPWLPWQDDIGKKIDATWMARVKEVVDYVVGQGMYCILNVHHDTGASNTAWLLADTEVYVRQKERFEAVWQQIAEEFRDYDEHLLFEGYNEMLDAKRSWCFASSGSASGYDAALAADAYKAINSYAQSFVDVVRATGGNNAQRNLIVSTYGACSGGGTWNSHLKDPLEQMALPGDNVADHLLFEVHSYPNISNLANAKSEVSEMMAAIATHLASRAPVVIGEWGTSDSEADYKNNRSNMLEFARYFVESAKEHGFVTLYWMGLSDGESRSVPQIDQPDLLQAIIKGYYGEEGYSAVAAPVREQQRDTYDVYNCGGQLLKQHVATLDGLAPGTYVVRFGRSGESRKIIVK